MNSWVFMTLVVVLPVTIGVLLLLAFWIFRRRCRRYRSVTGKFQTLWSENARPGAGDLRRKNYRAPPALAGENKKFNWSDHPTLINEAVEDGWPRFGFAIRAGNGIKFEIGWEIYEGSADFMQRIRFNPGRKRNKAGLDLPFGVAVAALPLPGPQLGNSAFPEEAYFEIIILPANSNGKDAEEEVVVVKKDEIMMSVGFTGEGSLPSKIPGSYSGSIGFNSTGSVCLDGKKLADESNKCSWRIGDGIVATTAIRVIGCGYNPSEKNIYFTVDSQLVHIIYCKNDPFGSPLYPALASNIDVSVFVNLGQCPFKFNPANAQRTPNPCFVVHPHDKSLIMNEDSRELFSIGRIDPQWQQWSSSTIYSVRDCLEVNQDFKDELFEIPLQASTKLIQ